MATILTDRVQRGRKPLHAEDLLITKPYAQVLKLITGKENDKDKATLKWLVRQGVESPRKPGKPLEKSRLSRVVNRLVVTGLVKRNGRELTSTSSLEQIKTRYEVKERMKGTDLTVIDRDLAIWGKFARYDYFAKGILPMLKELPGALALSAFRLAIRRLDIVLRGITYGDDWSNTEKAFALIEARNELMSVVNQLGWNSETLKAFDVRGVADKLINESGLSLIEDTPLREDIQSEMNNLEAGLTTLTKERSDEIRFEKLEPALDSIRVRYEPLIVIRCRIPEGDDARELAKELRVLIEKKEMARASPKEYAEAVLESVLVWETSENK